MSTKLQTPSQCVIWCLGEGKSLPFLFWGTEVFLLSHSFSFDCLELPWQFIYIGLKQFSVSHTCLWIYMTFLASATQVHHKTGLFTELSPPLSTHSCNRTEDRQIWPIRESLERNALITKPDMKRYNQPLKYFLCYGPCFIYITGISETHVLGKEGENVSKYKPWSHLFLAVQKLGWVIINCFCHQL